MIKYAKSLQSQEISKEISKKSLKNYLKRMNLYPEPQIRMNAYACGGVRACPEVQSEAYPATTLNVEFCVVSGPQS